MTEHPREAIPVGRFSTDKQDEGDSIRRQQNSFTRVCQRWELQPSNRWAIFDKGMSGFHGEHLSARAELGRFLLALEAGKVQPDGYGRMPVLVWEAVDRMTRLPQLLATDLVKRLVNAGLAILFDEADLWIDKDTIKDKWIILQVLIDQAYQYSRRLSRRLKSAWQDKRHEATPDNPVSKRCPSWVDWDEVSKRFGPNDGAKAIQFIFEQTVAGAGQRQVVGELQRRFTPIGTSEKWNSSFVQSVLNDRAVLGEFQPYEFSDSGDRVPVGKPIPGYYPCVIDEGLWYRAQAAKLRRKKQKGPSGLFVNLFTGSVFNGFDKFAMHIETTRTKREQSVYVQRRLTSYGHKSKVAGSCAISVDYYDFERAMLYFLRDVNPDDLTADDKRVSRLREAEGELAGVQGRLTELQEAMEDAGAGNVKTLVATVANVERRRDALHDEVERLRAEVQSSGPLRHAKTVLDVLENAQGDELHALRLRLRGLITEAVEKITVFPVKHFGRVSAIAQITLRKGDVRNIAFADGWQQWKVLLDDQGEWNDEQAIGTMLDELRERAERLARADPQPIPDVIPDTLGPAAEVWLNVMRGKMAHKSFRVVPSKVRRFVTLLGSGLATSKIDAGRWRKWVRWLRAEIAGNRLEMATARVAYSRAREFVRWLQEQSRTPAIKGLDLSATRAMKE